MGLWFPDVELSSDERVAFRAPGNLFSGRRQVGVQITVTDRRLVVVPNRLDALFRGRGVELPRDRIAHVQIDAPNSPAARSRGLGARFRSQVEIRSGEKVWVVTVVHPNDLVSALTNDQL